jgi:hypothetical protein
MADEEVDLVATWRKLIADETRSWVLFENGTCVALPDASPGDDLAASAIALMREWGPVQVATPSADFNVLPLAGLPGWVVTCHHPDILNYLSPDDMVTEDTPEMMIGLIGRSRRDLDSQELKVVHVEDGHRPG